jgi:hypothetical protein
MKQLQGLAGVALATGLALAASAAGAQVTSGESASILVFPKIIVDASWDTTVQLSNDADRPAYAHCYYVNGQQTFPDLPPGPLDPPLWTQVDFRLRLSSQQPTQWVVSRGRAVDPSDAHCPLPAADCDGTGIDPGPVPAVPLGFTGELLCIEVDASGAPWSGNALGGHATLKERESGEIVNYSGIGVRGLQTNDADGTLCIGGAKGAVCPSGAEYQGCSNDWLVAHPASFDDRAVDGEANDTRLTVVPCTQDLLTKVPTTVTLQFLLVTEFEQMFSVSTSINCWADLRLADVSPVFDRDTVGANWMLTRVFSSATTQSGFLAVQQTERRAARPPQFAAAATVPQQGDNATHADLIRISEEAVP